MSGISVVRAVDGFTAPGAEATVKAFMGGHAGSPAHPLVGGNELRLFVDTPNWVEQGADDIARADRYVLMRFFGISADGSGGKLLDAALKRLDQGASGKRSPVEVHLMYDRVGSHTLFDREARKFFKSLEARGIAVHPTGRFAPQYDWLTNYSADHGKQLITDSTTTTGGINPYGKHDHWHDYMVQARGPVVGQAALEYLARMADEGIPISTRLREAVTGALTGQPEVGEAMVRMLSNTPGGPKHLTTSVFDAIAGADTLAWGMTPYLGSAKVPDRLIDAAARGVDARLVLPSPEGNQWRLHMNRAEFPDLVDGGVKVYEHDPGYMVHSKGLLTDKGKKLVSHVGSGNFNTRSQRSDHEVGMEIHVHPDSPFGRAMKALFDSDIARARPIDRLSPRFRATARIADALGIGN